MKQAAQPFSTLIINHQIRMISEGSCDTEAWSNDALITGINYSLTEDSYFK